MERRGSISSRNKRRPPSQPGRHGRADSDCHVQIPAQTALSPSPPQEAHRRRQGSLRRLEEGDARRQIPVGLDGLEERLMPSSMAESPHGNRMITKRAGLLASPVGIPASPPTVWSPSLKSNLIFSPGSPVVSPSNKELPGLPPHRPMSNRTARDITSVRSVGLKSIAEGGSPSRLPVTRKRTLHGPRTPARKSTISSAHAARGAISPALPGGPRDPVYTSPARNTTRTAHRDQAPPSPAQRYHARRNANTTVEGILFRGYSNQSERKL